MSKKTEIVLDCVDKYQHFYLIVQIRMNFPVADERLYSNIFFIFAKKITVIIMKYQLFVFLFCTLLLAGCFGKQETVSCYDLRCENLSGPLAIDNTQPHLSWKVEAQGNDIRQTAYRIIVSSSSVALDNDSGDLWDSGIVESPQSVMIPYQGIGLSSPSLAYWKVKVWDNRGNASAWSRTERFGVGILNESDWKADYIGLSADDTTMIHSPLLRKSFETKRINGGSYLLHVNSLGYHEVYLNGAKVGEDVLSPAVSQMDKRSLSITYDVTDYVQDGKNDLVLWLGQGWYRKGLCWGRIGDGPFVKARLDVAAPDGCRTLLATDDSWLGSESEYSGIGNWLYQQFGGERVDARKALLSMDREALDQKEWKKVMQAEDLPDLRISPQMCEPNRIREKIRPTEITPLAEGVWLVDMGTTLNGWIEFNFPEMEAGHEVRFEYSDHFNDEGEIAYIGQEDLYIASGQPDEVFRNKFNYHAFRYIRISNLPIRPEPENIMASLIHTGFGSTSSFESSDPDLNAIHDMIHYTFQCLTLGGYLVDCPHLERLGYGGDGHASTQTIQTMYDVAPMYYNWMQAWYDCMRPEGSLPHTAPAPYSSGGGPYWCAFVIAGSWRTYINYGDDRLIRKYYPMFQRWLKYVDMHKVNGLLKRWPDEKYRGWYLGDWATPEGIDQTDERSVDLVNNCCISVCYDYMTKIAALLGHAEDEQKYKAERTQLNQLIHRVFYVADRQTYGTGTQIDLAYPMLAGATPEALINSVEKQFEQETENRNGHLSTGLVGVPVVTEWAVKNRKAQLMYSMLKKRDYPGYLYMVDQGATTTWEHWNGERSRIHNCYNGVGSWFYEAIGGIRPDENAPGYRHFYISPQIPEDLTWAKISKETPYGTVQVNWKTDGATVRLDVVIPVGSEATVVLPEDGSGYSLNGEALKSHEFRLSSGAYSVSWDVTPTQQR
jgi:alpha-L-rhamnosidase